jgi:hypothetical protein
LIEALPPNADAAVESVKNNCAPLTASMLFGLRDPALRFVMPCEPMSRFTDDVIPVFPTVKTPPSIAIEVPLIVSADTLLMDIEMFFNAPS